MTTGFQLATQQWSCSLGRPLSLWNTCNRTEPSLALQVKPLLLILSQMASWKSYTTYKVMLISPSDSILQVMCRNKESACITAEVTLFPVSLLHFISSKGLMSAGIASNPPTPLPPTRRSSYAWIDGWMFSKGLQNVPMNWTWKSPVSQCLIWLNKCERREKRALSLSLFSLQQQKPHKHGRLVNKSCTRDGRTQLWLLMAVLNADNTGKSDPLCVPTCWTLVCRLLAVCLWWWGGGGGGGITAAKGQTWQSSSEDKTTRILTGLIGSLTADIERTCDYFRVIYGLTSGVRGQLTPVSSSLALFPFHSSSSLSIWAQIYSQCQRNVRRIVRGYLEAVSPLGNTISDLEGQRGLQLLLPAEDKEELTDTHSKHAKVSISKAVMLLCFRIVFLGCVKCFICRNNGQSSSVYSSIQPTWTHFRHRPLRNSPFKSIILVLICAIHGWVGLGHRSRGSK